MEKFSVGSDPRIAVRSTCKPPSALQSQEWSTLQLDESGLGFLV